MPRRTNIRPGDPDSFALKLGVSAYPLPVSEDSVLLLRDSQEPVTPELRLEAHFNLGADVELSAGLALNDWREQEPSSGTFQVWLIDMGTWARTDVGTYPGTVTGNSLLAEISEASLGVMLDGQQTLAVEVTLLARGKTHRRTRYFNHLGVFEFADSIRRRVNQMESFQPFKSTGRIS